VRDPEVGREGCLAADGDGQLAFGLTFGLTIGLATGLTIGLAAGLADSSPQVVGPRDVICADGIYGLVAGVTYGLLCGLAVGLVGGLAAGLTVALATGLAIGLTWAAGVWTRYHISVAIAAARGAGPMRYGAFLDWAAQTGLLRVSGVAYQFRHRQLQDWLTSHAQEEPSHRSQVAAPGGSTGQALTS
jgi:hypothetical protein